MNKAVRVRIARVSDYSACLPLFTSLYQGDIGTNFKTAFEEYVKSEGGLVLVAEQVDVIIGVLVGSYHLDIDWEGNTAKIDAVVVDERSRKKGIGAKLVKYFAAKARSAGCRAVKSRVNANNTIAQSFYGKQGFKRLDTYEYVLDFQLARGNA